MKQISLILIFTLCSLMTVISQTDSLYTVNQEMDTIDAKYDRIYRLFVADNREVNHLWKVNLVGFYPLKPNIVFEQRIGKSFSSESSMSLGSTSLNYIRIGDGTGPGKFNDFVVNVGQEFKYYYNYKRRERKGKRTNGFNGNYFSIYAGGVYQEIFFSTLTLNKNVSCGICYGLQRRIGNIGYFDISGSISKTFYLLEGIQIENPTFDHLSIGIHIGAGFAIDSFKHLKRNIH